jgi:hypothetical protein
MTSIETLLKQMQAAAGRLRHVRNKRRWLLDSEYREVGGDVDSAQTVYNLATRLDSPRDLTGIYMLFEALYFKILQQRKE